MDPRSNPNQEKAHLVAVAGFLNPTQVFEEGVDPHFQFRSDDGH